VSGRAKSSSVVRDGEPEAPGGPAGLHGAPDAPRPIDRRRGHPRPALGAAVQQQLEQDGSKAKVATYAFTK
jgi:hypothetical protein